MFHSRAALLATALCAGLAAAPVRAQPTPDGLWQAWQDRAMAAGHTLTATAAPAQEGLALEGLVLERRLGTGTVALGLDRVVLAQDGAAVRATLAAGATVTLTTQPGGDDADDRGGPGGRNGDALTAVLALGDAPLSATATGDARDPSWTLAAETASLTLVSLRRDGTPVPATARVDLAGLGGTLSGLASAAPLAATLRADRLASEIETSDPATGETIRNTATQADTTLRATLTEDATASAPWTLDATVTGGASEAVSLRSGPAGSVESDSRQDSAALALTMTDRRTAYDAQVSGLTLTVTGSLLPAGPLGAAARTAALALSIPTGRFEGTQTAEIALDLNGVIPDAALWALLDPLAALPRDPLAATIRLEADLASPDPDATAPDGTPLPGLLPRALRIPTLALTQGAASVTGDGAVDIPTGPMGLPDAAQATGSLDLRATGVNGLLQGAVGAGALSMEQMMGAQMLLGMFATQDAGDSFTTRIELLPEGGVSVNGTRVR